MMCGVEREDPRDRNHKQHDTMTTSSIKSRIKIARELQNTITEMMKTGQIGAFEGADMWAKSQKEIRWLISLL